MLPHDAGHSSQKVAEVQAESEAIFRSIGDGAIATDEFGHITRINPMAQRILGLKPKEALGQWFPRILPIMREDKTPLALIERPIVQMFLTGKSVTAKVRYILKDGSSVPVSITVSPIILNGRPVGAIEVFRDITEEQEIDRMKSEFISLASHQLRTPLSTIKTYTHMLADGYFGPLAAPQTAPLQTVITAANTMNELISVLLNIARIESGSIAISTSEYDAAQLVTDVIKQLQITADARGVRLRFIRPAAPANLCTDSLIAKEILANLISNAIKYTPTLGTVTIRVRDLQHSVRIAVHDTGIGIPRQVHDKIFAKFFRAPNAVREETVGTGLGLYVVQGLVTTLHGKIWFRSAEDAGSTFYVSLPKSSVSPGRTADL